MKSKEIEQLKEKLKLKWQELIKEEMEKGVSGLPCPSATKRKTKKRKL